MEPEHSLEGELEPNAHDFADFEPLEEISPEQLLAAFEGNLSEEATNESRSETLSPDVEVEVRVPEEAPVPEMEATELAEAAESTDLLPDPFEIQIDEETTADVRAWYIIHCYSGYEQKVKHNLEQRIESMGMQDFIFQVVVPTIEEIEIKNGQRRTVERCLYPGYIMVQMILGDDPWYTVRNTPGVTGFVGMGNTPVPLRSEQVQKILHKMEAAAPQVRATFKLGQKVRIIEGPFADFIGVVEDLDEQRAKVRILVSFFGRETPVELDFLQVERT